MLTVMDEAHLSGLSQQNVRTSSPRACDCRRPRTM